MRECHLGQRSRLYVTLQGYGLQSLCRDMAAWRQQTRCKECHIQGEKSRCTIAASSGRNREPQQNAGKRVAIGIFTGINKKITIMLQSVRMDWSFRRV
jgi:hypothetical protein